MQGDFFLSHHTWNSSQLTKQKQVKSPRDTCSVNCLGYLVGILSISFLTFLDIQDNSLVISPLIWFRASTPQQAIKPKLTPVFALSDTKVPKYSANHCYREDWRRFWQPKLWASPSRRRRRRWREWLRGWIFSVQHRYAGRAQTPGMRMG